MLQALVTKLERRDQLSAEERRVLEGAVARVRDVKADEDIVREGDEPSESSVMLEGFSARYKILSNGRRQITALHVLGDFVDLSLRLVDFQLGLNLFVYAVTSRPLP